MYYLYMETLNYTIKLMSYNFICNVNISFKSENILDAILTSYNISPGPILQLRTFCLGNNLKPNLSCLLEILKFYFHSSNFFSKILQKIMQAIAWPFSPNL